jgi:hypothetical protein
MLLFHKEVKDLASSNSLAIHVLHKKTALTLSLSHYSYLGSPLSNLLRFDLHVFELVTSQSWTEIGR